MYGEEIKTRSPFVSASVDSSEVYGVVVSALANVFAGCLAVHRRIRVPALREPWDGSTNLQVQFDAPSESIVDSQSTGHSVLFTEVSHSSGLILSLVKFTMH